jgi:hypothetical protein
VLVDVAVRVGVAVRTEVGVPVGVRDVILIDVVALLFPASVAVTTCVPGLIEVFVFSVAVALPSLFVMTLKDATTVVELLMS